jgi:hypothetical protein
MRNRRLDPVRTLLVIVLWAMAMAPPPIRASTDEAPATLLALTQQEVSPGSLIEVPLRIRRNVADADAFPAPARIEFCLKWNGSVARLEDVWTANLPSTWDARFVPDASGSALGVVLVGILELVPPEEFLDFVVFQFRMSDLPGSTTIRFQELAASRLDETPVAIRVEEFGALTSFGVSNESSRVGAIKARFGPRP